jgi:hypothetical protein
MPCSEVLTKTTAMGKPIKKAINADVDISSIRQDALTAIAQFEVLGYARPAH